MGDIEKEEEGEVSCSEAESSESNSSEESNKDFSQYFAKAVAKWRKHRIYLTADPSSILGLNLQELPHVDEVIAQSRILIHDYVVSRLRKQGLLTPRLEMRLKVSPEVRVSDVSMEIQTIGGELERLYPGLFTNISRQLHLTMHSESTVCRTLTAVGDAMFKGSNVLTWGRVVSLFALSAAFATDCVHQGHSDFVKCVIDTFVELTKVYIAPWVVKQGGWVSMQFIMSDVSFVLMCSILLQNDIIRTFRTSNETAVLWLITVLGALIGFIVMMTFLF